MAENEPDINNLTLFFILCGALCSAVEIKGIRYVTETKERIRFARFRDDIPARPSHKPGLNPAKAYKNNPNGCAFSLL